MSEMKIVTATKGVILHTHEVRRLLDAGEACIVRPLNPEEVETMSIAMSPIFRGDRIYNYAGEEEIARCSIGLVGDSRWVRETWQARVFTNHEGDAVDGVRIIYVADNTERWFHDEEIEADWAMPKNARKGNISGSAMPQWASRLTITTTAVACKRVQQITYHEVLAAGIKQASSVPYGNHEQDTIETFQEMWDRRHKKTPWASNTFVFVSMVKVVAK